MLFELNKVQKEKDLLNDNYNCKEEVQLSIVHNYPTRVLYVVQII